MQKKESGKRYDYDRLFELAWRLYPARLTENPKRPAFIAWRARVRSGVNPELLILCVDNYAAAMRQRGKTGTDYIMHGSTFFGPNERWKDFQPPREVAEAKMPKRPPPSAPEPVDYLPPEEAKRFAREMVAQLAAAKGLSR